MHVESPRVVPPPPRRSRRIARGLIVLSGTTALLLLLAEAVLRLAGISPPMTPPPRYVADAELFFRGAPGALVDGPDPEERLNAGGFRDRDRPSARSPRRKRILVAGDSFAYGLEVAREEAFPRLLEERLAGTEVWNLAMPSYTTIQEAVVLRRQVPRLQPDAVILAFCMGNDWFENLTVPDMTVVGGRLVTTAFRDALSSRHALPVIEAELALRRHSHLYTLLARAGWTAPLWSLLFAGAPENAREQERTLRRRHFATIRKVYGAMYDPSLRDDPAVRKAFARTFDALGTIHETLRGKQVPWLLVIVPDVDQVKRSIGEKPPHPPDTQAASDGAGPPGPTPTSLPWAHRSLHAWAAKEGVPVLDLLEATLASDSPLAWYEPGGHWSATGHARAAENIQAALRNRLHVP